MKIEKQQLNIMEVLKMRTELIKSLLAHAHGEISYHKANVNVYFNNPAGIGEHSDIMGAITNELERIAYYEDQVEVIEKHFKS